jgi:RTX calcium-binding nonapeptide repeat (4 copies)
MSRIARLGRLVALVASVAALSTWSATAGAASPGPSSLERATSAPRRVLAPATPTMITFEVDATGSHDEPFTSVDNPTVHFVDTIGNDIDTTSPGSEADGIGMRIFGDDASALVILFDVPTAKVSILFGNDDPGFTQAGDTATLTVYRNGAKVATKNAVMNRDDAANQRVTYSGSAVDKAKFVFTRAGAPIDLIEVVDNIILAPLCTISGNAQANTLKGTAGSNGICGKGGPDKIDGKAGNDWISGAGGNDILTGGDGNDLVVGLDGADVIRASDGVSGNDTVFAGGGNDSCFIDAGDTAVGCDSLVTNP